MKKFFEKYDLVKTTGILVLLAVFLTWLIPLSYFSGSEMVTEDIQRVGLSNFFEMGLTGLNYFTVLITFLFVMGGFYQVLSKRPGYQKLIKNISEKLKGCEIPVVLIVSLLFAIASSLTNEYFPLLALIPFVITILNRMKVDKISTFVATFGGLLVGAIGSTYSPKLAGTIIETFSVDSNSIIITQAILFIVSYALLAALTCFRLIKNKNAKKHTEFDKFALASIDTPKKAPKTWPYAVGIILFATVTVLAYLPWSTWQITLFTDITKWFNELSIADVPFVSYIFGEIMAFGTWDILTIQFVMIFATLLIHWFGRVPLDEIFESYGEGFKKIGNVVIVLLTVYLVLEIAVLNPILPTIVDWLANIVSGFNAFFAFIGAFITSIFSVEMQYAMSLAGTYYSATFAEMHNTLAIIFQSAFGFVSFFVPSSAILMLGLSYLGISYKEWMKFIWKFLIALLVAIAVIIFIIA